MSYSYKASETYWKNFHSLSSEAKAATREAWKLFKDDPFDPRLRTHKIESLSNRAKETIRSVVVSPDLRVIFTIRGDVVYTIDIGTHDIYK